MAEKAEYVRMLVCGGRDWVSSVARVNLVQQVLSALPVPDILIVGGDDTDRQNSVDGTAFLWALNRGIPIAVVKPHWDRWKRAAGPMRNAAMLKLCPTLVVAFPGGRGTEDMVRKANAAGVPVRHVDAIGWIDA